MIPGVTFERMKHHPTAAYNKAVEELVNERVRFKLTMLLKRKGFVFWYSYKDLCIIERPMF